MFSVAVVRRKTLIELVGDNPIKAVIVAGPQAQEKLSKDSSLVLEQVDKVDS